MHRIVGLDVGTTELRCVALESGFRGFSVLQARSAPLPAASAPAERLRQGLFSLGVVLGEDVVAMALPGAQVASHLFTLPFTDPRRIAQVLPAEVEGAIPFELEEVVFDHAVLSQHDGKSEILVAVVRKAVLAEWLSTMKEAGVDPRLVTFAPLALGEAARRRGPGTGPAVSAQEGGQALLVEEQTLLLDAGPDRADLAILRGETAQVCRSLGASGAVAWEAAARDPQAAQRLLSPLIRDLKISLRARPRGAAEAPRRLWLAGALATLPGAPAVLAAELSLEVAPLQSSPSLALPAGSAAASEVALALGLALSAQQPRGRLNFRRGEFAFTRDFSRVRKQAATLAIAAAVLVALALMLAFARLGSLGRQLRNYDDALCAATRRILGQCTTDSRQALSRLSGGASKAAGIPRVSAAEVLAEVMEHLPDGAMPLVEEVEVTTTSVRVRGTAEGFGQVDQITAALKGDKCFGEIKPPRVEKQRDSQKVSFTVDFPYTCSGEAGGA